MCVNAWNLVADTLNGQIDVSTCGCCYRVRFNNIMMTLDFESLEQYYFEILDCHITVKDDEDKDSRLLFFQSKLSNLAFMYSVNEISELHYLLETTVLQSPAYA